MSAVHPAYPRHIGIVLKLNYYGMYSDARNLSHVSQLEGLKMGLKCKQDHVVTLWRNHVIECASLIGG